MSTRWQRGLVVGASSGMGEALARQLAQRGCQVALVARRRDELARVAEAITAAGGSARIYAHDVRDYACVPALLQQIALELGGLDIVIYAAGVMPLLAEDEYCLDKDRQTIEVNAMGAVAWLNEAAQRFARSGAGAIVGISSVAGDRGRGSMPVYAASKAFLDAYLEGLRNRIGRYGVKVVTVKPGPVDTPMTRDLDRKRKPMLIGVEQAASAILSAANRDGVVYVPGKWRPVMWIIRHIPSPLFKKLKI